MSLVDFAVHRRVTVCMLSVALVIFGTVAFTRLPVTLLPELSYPTLTVESRYPGAAPGEIEVLVSRPLEEAVGITGGVQRIVSVSRPGVSQVTLEFGWGRNMDFAAIDVREKLDRVVLPREATRPVVLRFDPNNDPVQRLYLTGPGDLRRLRYVAEEIIKKDLESTSGVAAIKVNGGLEEEIQVRVDEGKLSLLGLTIQDVNRKLQQENVNQAGGSLYESEARYLVRARNEFRDLQDILATVILTKDDRNITMKDVGEVVRGHRQREVVTRFNGKEAVELAVYKEGDANTVAVARAIDRRLERVRKELPADFSIVAGVDQSRFIQASIDEVIENAIAGGLIAVLVLLFFLKDLGSTLVISFCIPISIIATFFLMYQTGTSLNIMSLGGLALGVGNLVDNAIVVLEAIQKRRERGEGALSAARAGAGEVGMAVTASTFTTVAVFVPVVFVEGIAAQIFRDQALTVSFSQVASLVVGLTLIPMMAALPGLRVRSAPAGAAAEGGPPAATPGRARRLGRFLFGGVASPALRGVRRGLAAAWRACVLVVRPLSNAFDASFEAVRVRYPVVLKAALRAPGTVLGLAFLALVGALYVGQRLGVDLIPQFSQGEFSFLVEMPEGTPLQVTDRFVGDVQAALEGDARVDAFSSLTGGAGLSMARTGTEGENVARLQVRMKPGTTRADEEAVAARLRTRLETQGVARFKLERPSYFTFRTPIEVEVYGDNLEDLQGAAALVKQSVERVPGLVDVKSSLQIGAPELQITFNREQLARLGLDLFQVASTLRNKVQGEVATRFLEGDREIDIRVRSVEPGAASVEDVRSMIVGQRQGVPLLLSSVAEVRRTEGPSEIRRIGQKRAVVISGNLAGRDMGAVAADIRAALRALPLPPGVGAGLSGQEEEMQRSFRSLLLALALAVFLVYLVMASQFESFLQPFIVMFTVPLGAIGAIGALALTGRSLDIVALMGMLMLAGIVVNNAIVLIDAVHQLRLQGMGKEEALVEGGLTRLRPIIMTSATTVLGLVPMCLGLGEGAELRAPLAITVIGGLSFATVLTLIVIPVVYLVVDRKRYATGAAGSAEPAPAGPTEGAPPGNRVEGAAWMPPVPAPAGLLARSERTE